MKHDREEVLQRLFTPTARQNGKDQGSFQDHYSVTTESFHK